MRFATMLSLVLLLGFALPAAPGEADNPRPPTRVALQISDHDPIRQTMVLSVANNLANHYGEDAVEIEIVAFGPGLTLLRDTSQFADRVAALADRGVRFSHCEITVASMEQREGQRPRLLPATTATPSGAVRIIDLVAKGYTHLAP